MNQKGQGLIIGILVGLLVAGGLFGAYYLGIRNNKPQTQNPVVTSTTQQTVQPSPSSTPDPTANWKTYTNNKIGFVIKYPADTIPQAKFGLGLGPVNGNESDILEFGAKQTDTGLSLTTVDQLEVIMVPFNGNVQEFVKSDLAKQTLYQSCLPSKLIDEEKINGIDTLFYDCSFEHRAFLTGKGYGFTFRKSVSNWTNTDLTILRSFKFTN